MRPASRCGCLTSTCSNGTAKLLLLFEPASGQARVQGVLSTANAVLHPWLKQQLSAILAALPATPPVKDAAANRRLWQRWQEGLRWPLGLPGILPALRLLLILDNLAGHLSQALVCWMFAQGIMPLYTPLGGSWLNMAESFQRILKRRALQTQHPQSSVEIITLLEQTAEGWNRQPTPFEWGGRRAERRRRERLRRHALGGSGAYTRRPVRWCTPRANHWQSPCQIDPLVALVGLAVGLTMPTLAQTNESAPSEQDRQQIEALAARYAEASNRHDAAAIAALFTEEGVIVSPERILSGRQAIEKLYRDTFNAATVSDTVIKTTELHVMGDLVWAVGQWRNNTQQGHWGSVDERRGGAWQLRMLTFNVTPPSAVPPPPTTPLPPAAPGLGVPPTATPGS
jgi:uncharacterized protein (TIGR02246 family)